MSYRKTLGLDGPVAYTFMARFVNIVGSTAMVLIIVRFLTPVEQGYYYTLISLVSLQIVFELGFSFVIQQMAAHECIHLTFDANGSVSGDRIAHARLASTLRLSLRWYSIASTAMGLILAPAGMVFFARHGAAGGAQIHWQGPWLCAACASMLGLWCTPFFSFIEGCGQIRAVAAMRFRQAFATSAFALVPMFLHHGLYAPAMALVGYVGTGFLFLLTRRRLLIGLLHHKHDEPAIQWKREVWPFQWRIGLSSLCSYFTMQVFIPILFALRGPVEAGQMGMSLSITGYITVLAMAWTSTKTTQFGSMIARHEFQALDRLFCQTLAQSLRAFLLIGLAACFVIALLPALAPGFAARILSPLLFALLMLASGANCLVQSLAILLRSFKYEPFLGQSVSVALLTLLLATLTASRWGNTGATFSYLIVTALLGLPFAWSIFVRARRRYMSLTGPTTEFDENARAQCDESCSSLQSRRRKRNLRTSAVSEG